MVNGFVGSLRPYQSDGVRWLEQLERARTGGILADDMGLGKTVQLLAYLAERRARRGSVFPSLVIVPKSLLHNWAAEIKRFTPGLRALVFAGPQRESLLRDIRGYDLVLISYASLRQDAEKLRPQEFELVIADEAQNIKNPKAQVSLACREIRAERRLAVTGTPIENSIGDLISLLDFSCPGKITAELRRKIEATVASRSLEDATVQVFSQLLAPHVLRRTKAQVLPDLPIKTEAHLYCELSARERKLYEELRVDYRSRLYAQIKRNGLGSAKIIILEALLRLRQACCHPALLYPDRISEPSTKLEVLLEQLEALIAEGHRALVFSQFTSMLDIVEPALRRRGFTYERLDGSSTDRERQEAVERFQSQSSDSRVFLASLKAGGTGLNLTAAGYVFILDPWWNPASESQAIDRAHRIGQKSPVVAYRLIAQGTIEEKIIALQAAKRELATSTLGGEDASNASLIASMTTEDVDRLFSD